MFMGSTEGRSKKNLLAYRSLLEEIGDCSVKEMIAFLSEELPFLWYEAYKQMASHKTNVVRLQHGTFEYIYDDYASLEASGSVQYDPKAEARLVAALGHSEPRKTGRDDYRLKGWIGPTEKMFGHCWDKGHFIAHSIGGSVDRQEVNVFVQRRDLNRGWSPQGKRFRKMEKYCVLNPGTFCFSRPLYDDQTARPSFIEFGILKKNGELWMECFDNRYHQVCRDVWRE